MRSSNPRSGFLVSTLHSEFRTPNCKLSLKAPGAARQSILSLSEAGQGVGAPALGTAGVLRANGRIRFIGSVTLLNTVYRGPLASIPSPGQATGGLIGLIAPIRKTRQVNRFDLTCPKHKIGFGVQPLMRGRNCKLCRQPSEAPTLPVPMSFRIRTVIWAKQLRRARPE
jgi:hypothetical protein